MEIIIRNNGIMTGRIVGDASVGRVLRELNKNLIEAEKKETSGCMAVYTLNDDLVIPVTTPNGDEFRIYVWKKCTSIAVYV